MGRWKEYYMEEQKINERKENFFKAISEDDSERVRDLIEEGVDVNATDDEGRTALFLAIEEGSIECLDVLVHCSDIEADEHGNTALHIAAKLGDPDCLEILVEYEMGTYKTNKAGNTALHVAAEQGQSGCVETLIESGIDLNMRNKDGKTALCVAAVNGGIECLRTLLYDPDGMQRAVFSFRDDNESLCETARKGHLDCVVELLCNQYALSEDDREMYAPRLTELSEFASSECGKLASSKTETDRLKGYVALCCASILCDMECLRALLDFGLDVNPPENLRKVTPLCYAAEYGSPECIVALLKRGADVRMVDEDGKSALHHASEGQCRRQMNEECVSLLLQAGAGVNVMDRHGNTPLALAVRKENDGCVKRLLSAGAKCAGAD